MSTDAMNGAQIVIQALKDQGVDVVFGYPGGAVLPIYDALFEQNHIRHIFFLPISDKIYKDLDFLAKS